MELFKIFGTIKLNDNVSKALDNASKKAKDFDTKLKNMGKGITDVGKKMSLFVTAPIVGAGVAMFKLASDMEESINKVNVAFGDNANEIRKWSNTTLESFGIAKNTALDMSALFGDMATSMGLTTSEASTMSMGLTGLAGDLASFKNIDIEQAMNSLKGVFTGETESLKNLGIVMTQTNLEAFALSQGIQKNVADMTESEKVNLRYAFILEKTKNAQGDFARTNEGSANQMRIFSERLKELGATFGAVLLPTITKVITKVNELMAMFGELNETQQKTILIVGGLVAIIAPLLIGVGSAIKLFVTLKPVLIAIGTFFGGISAPIWITIGAVTALIAIFVLLWKKNEAFRNGVIKIWETIKKFFIDSINFIKTKISDGFNAIQKFWQKWGYTIVLIVLTFWEKLKTTYVLYFNLIKDIVVKAFNIIKDAFKTYTQNFVLIIKSFLSLFKGDWKQAIGYVAEIAKNMWEYIKNLFTNIKNLFVDFGKNVGDIFRNLLKGDLSAVKQNADNISKGISGAFATLPMSVKGIFSKVKDETSEGLKEVEEVSDKKFGDVFADEKFDALGSMAGESLGEGLKMELSDELESTMDKVGDFVSNFKSEIDDMGMAVVDALRNRYQMEEDQQRSSYEKQFNTLQKQTDRNIAQYDRELSAKLRLFDDGTNEQISAIRKQIDAINNQTEAEEEQLRKQEYAKRLAEKQKQLANAESVEEQQKALMELQDFIEAENRRRLKEERSDQVESLRQKIDLIRESRNKEREQIIAETEERKNAELFKQAFVKDSLETQFEATMKHYETLKGEEALQHEARMIITEQNNDEIIKLLESYNPKWKQTGQSFGEMLLDGLQSKESQIKATINRLLRSVDRARELSASLGSYNAIQSYAPAMATATGASSTVVNITGNTIMNDRDADRFGGMLVDRLRTLGVK